MKEVVLSAYLGEEPKYKLTEAPEELIVEIAYGIICGRASDENDFIDLGISQDICKGELRYRAAGAGGIK